MPSIPAININDTSRSPPKNRWGYFKDFASIVCSRESTYRTALDITAFDIPLIFSDLFRSFKKTLESVLEGLCGTVMVVVAPYITTFVGKIMAKKMLPENMQKDAINYLQFTLPELRDQASFEAATKRIKQEETKDKDFIASLYTRTGNDNKAERYKEEKEKLEKFFDTFETTEEKRKQIYKLKKATIIGESFIEGGWWGGFGLVLRAFRKYVLKEDRFTGTKGYASDAESESLGEAGDLNWFQKTIGTAAIFVSPLLNTYLLTKAEDKEAAKKSKFFKWFSENFDMTHGVYPNLPLLFTITTIPKWISTITLSQGWYERGERILKLLTVIPSWWMGHRATNGLFAKHADKELAKKYNTKEGILVEQKYLDPIKKDDSFIAKLSKWLPEPAKIHHIVKTTEGNAPLQAEAEDLHARSLYKGFAMHSLLVWVINMGVNYITKLRVKHALGE